MAETAPRKTLKARTGSSIGAAKRNKAEEKAAAGVALTSDGPDVVASAGNDGPVQKIAGVEIEVLPISPRAARPKQEDYPFSKLPVSEPDENGILTGPSFFIPENDNPLSHLATARKWVTRSAGQPEYYYQTRADVKDGVEGRRVWRVANPDFKPS